MAALKKVKYVLIIPLCIILCVEGFIGGTGNKDIWNDLVK